MPSRMAGAPSSRNIHCQPEKPAKSCVLLISQPESGAPITEDSTVAVMKPATARPRSFAGNQ